MGYMLEADGDYLKLTITAVEGFAVAVSVPNGTITLVGSKDAFAGIGELLRDELGEDE